MKFKTITQKIAGEYTRDGRTVPVTRNQTSEIPVLPRDWMAIALRTVVTIVIGLTVLSIVWSTWSIGSLLHGGIGYAAAVTFDIAWGVTLLLEYLARYDVRKRRFPTILGWVLLAATMLAIGWHGVTLDSWPMAVVGATVSAFAKGLWMAVMKHVNAELSEEDQQWIAVEVSSAQAKAAIATMRRQSARTEQRATLELLAMEKERRDVAVAFGLDAPETEVMREPAQPLELRAPTFSEISKSDAIRIAAGQYPDRTHSDLSEILGENGVDAAPDYIRQVLNRRKTDQHEIPDAEVIELRK